MNWKKWYRECALCPRECGVNRLEGRRGFCGQTAGLKVARAVLHMWEEPCISGSRGSGTVFFTGCHLGCVFCQNGQISRGSAGKEISVIRLARIFMELQEKGAHNINLVTPTHFVPHIIEALRISRKMGLKLPIVYNTGGFEKVDTLELLDGWIDVYLTDFKFMDVHLSGRYAHEEGYSFYAAKALEEMYRQTGEPVFDENGLMTKGIIVRHMVLPGQSMDSRQIVDFLYENYGDKIYLSLMNQYTPSGPLEKYPELQKRVKRQVYERLIGYTIRKGVENAYIQEGSTAKESFIPDFNGEGV
ncbi:radical SAM protein [Frisingicoccus sp.]|uniref:radical SAM protein n=1 Tax=Frisingicoccus sp. TaxID=1918627 RepID=UPI0015C0F40F